MPPLADRVTEVPVGDARDRKHDQIHWALAVNVSAPSAAESLGRRGALGMALVQDHPDR
jgi:hypothetical protein